MDGGRRATTSRGRERRIQCKRQPTTRARRFTDRPTGTQCPIAIMLITPDPARQATHPQGRAYRPKKKLETGMSTIGRPQRASWKAKPVIASTASTGVEEEHRRQQQSRGDGQPMANVLGHRFFHTPRWTGVEHVY